MTTVGHAGLEARSTDEWAGVDTTAESAEAFTRISPGVLSFLELKPPGFAGAIDPALVPATLAVMDDG